MPKPIKLNGREAALIKVIGFGLGITGQEIRDRMQMADHEIVDLLNAMLSTGFLEAASMDEQTTVDRFATEIFEVNPGYAMELRDAIQKRH